MPYTLTIEIVMYGGCVDSIFIVLQFMQICKISYNISFIQYIYLHEPAATAPSCLLGHLREKKYKLNIFSWGGFSYEGRVEVPFP